MKNPILGKVHEADATKIAQRFPALSDLQFEHLQTLWKYIYNRPQRFFSELAFDCFMKELMRLDKADHQALRSLLQDNIESIDNALRHISEINGFSWHDDPMEGEDDYRKLMLIDQFLNPAYLRLVEAVLKPLLVVPAYFSRKSRAKGTEKLELYDIVIELAGTGFEKILHPYEATVRNGIAHGGVTYRANTICYMDKKGNSKEFRDSEVIQIFDDILDVCNGLVAALSGFLLAQPDIGYPRPNNLRMEELRAETSTPYWGVVGWVPSEQINGSQLLVYVEVDTNDYNKTLFSSVQTAILAERLTPGFDRYFLSLTQPHGLRGFCAFNGPNLSNHREAGHEIEHYNDILEDTGLFFVPRYKLPKLLTKIGSLWLVFRVQAPLIKSEYRKNLGLVHVIIRRSEIHRNSWGVVLRADVILEDDGTCIEKDHIRRQCKSIIRKSLREARRKQSYLSLLRYLPLGYARVHIFQKDYRRRRLANFGLAGDLIGTVEIKRIQRIKSPDIFGSDVERKGNIRTAWNRNWLKRREMHDVK